jgi:hypothetical protein
LRQIVCKLGKLFSDDATEDPENRDCQKYCYENGSGSSDAKPAQGVSNRCENEAQHNCKRYWNKDIAAEIKSAYYGDDYNNRVGRMGAMTQVRPRTAKGTANSSRSPTLENGHVSNPLVIKA